MTNRYLIDRFDLEAFIIGFCTERGISEISIQTLLNKIGKKLFKCFKSKVKKIKKDLKSQFDKILFMKDRNIVQTETNPGLNLNHFFIAISNGEFYLNLKMYQLFSLNYTIDTNKDIIIEKCNHPCNELIPLFERICDNKYRNDDADWMFSIFEEKRSNHTNSDGFFILFFCTLFYIISHEFGERYYRDYQEEFQKKSGEIEDFINDYLDEEGLHYEFKPREMSDWKREIFSDYIGMELTLKALKSKVRKKLIYLACMNHFLLKNLCDQWHLRKWPIASSATRIKVDSSHPPNKLRLKYIQNLIPNNMRELSQSMLEASEKFLFFLN